MTRTVCPRHHRVHATCCEGTGRISGYVSYLHRARPLGAPGRRDDGGPAAPCGRTSRRNRSRRTRTGPPDARQTSSGPYRNAESRAARASEHLIRFAGRTAPDPRETGGHDCFIEGRGTMRFSQLHCGAVVVALGMAFTSAVPASASPDQQACVRPDGTRAHRWPRDAFTRTACRARDRSPISTPHACRTPWSVAG
jgi:hypothetical protein